MKTLILTLALLMIVSGCDLVIGKDNTKAYKRGYERGWDECIHHHGFHPNNIFNNTGEK